MTEDTNIHGTYATVGMVAMEGINEEPSSNEVLDVYQRMSILFVERKDVIIGTIVTQTELYAHLLLPKNIIRMKLQ